MTEMTMANESKLIQEFKKSIEVKKFVLEIVSKFQVRKIQVEYMLLQEAKDLANFDAFNIGYRNYILKAIDNCSRWSILPRKN